MNYCKDCAYSREHATGYLFCYCPRLIEGIEPVWGLPKVIRCDKLRENDKPCDQFLLQRPWWKFWGNK